MNMSRNVRWEPYAYYRTFDPKLHLFICYFCKETRKQPEAGTPTLGGEVICLSCLGGIMALAKC